MSAWCRRTTPLVGIQGRVQALDLGLRQEAVGFERGLRLTPRVGLAVT